MKNVLLTGATGFIGSKLIVRLLSEGVKVVHIAPNDELAHQFDNLGVKGYVCSLNEIHTLKEKIPLSRYDVFYHLAWDGVSTDHKNDYEKQLGNINYCLNICRFAHMVDCKKVIIPGSTSEYAYAGEAVNGCQVPQPADAYSAAKASAHILCDLYSRQVGLNFIWILVPSVYGPGRTDNNIVTYTIKALLNNERPSFTSLKQRWDYLYIDDLVESLYLVGAKGLPGKIYVTGSGLAKPLREYIEIIRNQINPDAELGIGEVSYKTKKIDNSVTDITLLQKDTGYMPSVSFEEGIRRTIDGYQKLYAERPKP